MPRVQMTVQRERVTAESCSRLKTRCTNACLHVHPCWSQSLASTATILVSTQVADVPRLAEGGPHSSGSSSRSSGWEGGGAPPQEAACRGTAGSDEGARAVAAAVAAAADYVPQALLSRLVYLMLSSEVPQVR